jgi:hypothetical protein
MDNQIFSALIPDASATTRTQIAKTLRAFGEPALRFAVEQGTQVRPLGRGERYADASPALARLGIDVDAWPAPPAGLFVVEERTVYVRSRSAMTIGHEFGHALDCALGGGVYRSGIDPAIRAAFSTARQFVTPYAASGLDEYFAECVRAWVEANDPASAWPAANRERLQRVDPAMHGIVKGIFDGFV